MTKTLASDLPYPVRCFDSWGSGLSPYQEGTLKVDIARNFVTKLTEVFHTDYKGWHDNIDVKSYPQMAADAVEGMRLLIEDFQRRRSESAVEIVDLRRENETLKSQLGHANKNAEYHEARCKEITSRAYNHAIVQGKAERRVADLTHDCNVANERMKLKDEKIAEKDRTITRLSGEITKQAEKLAQLEKGEDYFRSRANAAEAKVKELEAALLQARQVPPAYVSQTFHDTVVDSLHRRQAEINELIKDRNKWKDIAVRATAQRVSDLKIYDKVKAALNQANLVVGNATMIMGRE